MNPNSSGLAENAPDVEAGIAQSRLFNADLAPVPMSRRKWGMLSFAALWISMSACIPTYMLASSLISGGMNWWQAVLTIFLANVIVLIPMILNAHAGTKYGIPFPVYCRAAFGTLGANVPAILRALVACGWFGIQTWIGGAAIYKIPRVVVGENVTFMGDEEHLRSQGVKVDVLNNAECIQMMKDFIAAKPQLWNEDIGV